MIELSNPHSIIESIWITPRTINVIGNFTINLSGSYFTTNHRITNDFAYIKLKPEFRKFDIVSIFKMDDLNFCREYIEREYIESEKGFIQNERNITFTKVIITDNKFDENLYIKKLYPDEKLFSYNILQVADARVAAKIKLLS